MEELGRADPATMTDGSTYPDSLATAAPGERASGRETEPTLAAATAALVLARWNGGNGARGHFGAWAPPEPREPPPARYDPYAPARGSAPVSPAGPHGTGPHGNGNVNGNGRGPAAEAPPVPAPATMPYPPVNQPTPYAAPPFTPTPYPGPPQSPATPYSPSAPYPPDEGAPVAPAFDGWRTGGSGLETLDPPRQPDPGSRIDPALLEAARLDAVRDLPRRGRSDLIDSDEPIDSGLIDPRTPLLPQRVPAEPDVPDVPLAPNDPLADPMSAPLANRTELSRIATYLRYDDAEETGERREGFDVAAILAAVRDVPDVADVHLRWNPDGVHVLRLELADGADPGEVSRAVVRLLKERMGLAAEPNAAPYPDGLEWTGGEYAGAGGSARLHRPYVTDQTRGPRPGTAPAALADSPPRPRRPARPGVPSRVIIDHVQVTTLGLEATVDVRLAVAEGGFAAGSESGPAVDAYLLRLAANAAVTAIDQLLIDPRTGQERGRCFIEHAAVVPFGNCEVATVVLLLVCAGVAEQLAGAAIVAGDPRHAIVRATLAALNRRLESLLA